jgi:hypothetical protein
LFTIVAAMCLSTNALSNHFELGLAIKHRIVLVSPDNYISYTDLPLCDPHIVFFIYETS